MKSEEVERKALELFRVTMGKDEYLTPLDFKDAKGWLRLARKWIRMEDKLERQKQALTTEIYSKMMVSGKERH